MLKCGMERKLRFGVLAAGLLCAALPARASEKDWRLSTSINYESGDYGTGTRFSSLYVPVTIKRIFGDAFASLTVPFVSQSTDGSVRNVGGRPVKTGKGGGSAGSVTTRSGLGDIVLRGGYDLLHDDPHPLDLTVVAKVKAPTADRNKGLGTGEFDAGAGLEAAKLVAPGWTVLADLYFTAIGDPPGTNLNNQVAMDVGFSRLLQESLTGTVLFEASNALVSGTPSPRDVRGILDMRISDEASVNASAMLGLSKGSADYGFGLGGTLRF